MQWPTTLIFFLGRYYYSVFPFSFSSQLVPLRLKIVTGDMLEEAITLPLKTMIGDIGIITTGIQTIIIALVNSKNLSVGIEVITGDTAVDVTKIPLAEVKVLENDIEIRINKFQQK